MLNKKILFYVLSSFFVVFVFSVLIPFSVYAEESSVAYSDIEQIEELTQKIQEIEDLPDIAKNKWEYLQKEWEKILLQNKFMAGLNNLLIVINPVFFILFGINWGLENFVLILGIFVLWGLFFYGSYATSRIFTEKTSLKLLSGFLFCLIIANIKVFEGKNFFHWLVNEIGKLIFSKEQGWARFILFFVFCIIILILFYLSNLLEKTIKISKEEEKKKELEYKVRKHEAFSKGLKEGESLVPK